MELDINVSFIHYGEVHKTRSEKKGEMKKCFLLLPSVVIVLHVMRSHLNLLSREKMNHRFQVRIILAVGWHS